MTKCLLNLTLASMAAVFGQNLESVSIASLGAPAVAPIALPGVAESPTKWSKTYNWSVAALGAATASDMASSFKFSSDGQKEANSFLRGANGGYGVKGAALEAGIVGGSLIAQHFLVKKYPNLRVPLAVANYALAGVQVFNVRHNLNY